MASKLRLDLAVVLPDSADECERCVDRLLSGLRSRSAVEEVHLVDESDVTPAQLCIHYDADSMSLSSIRQLAFQNGIQISERYGHLLLAIQGIRHPRRARSISLDLRKEPGVLEAEATAAGFLKIEYDTETFDRSSIDRVLRRYGLTPTPADHHPSSDPNDQESEGAARTLQDGDISASSSAHASIAARSHQEGHDHAGHSEHRQGHAHVHRTLFGIDKELAFAVLSGILVVGGWMLNRFGGIDGIGTACFLGAYFFGGFFTLREAIQSIRSGRFEIDFLMLVAAGGAAILGEYFEGALLLFLFSLGHALEHFAMGRARQAIEALADLTPDTAIVRRDGREIEVPVSDLFVGETIVIRTNERIPADGIVTRGSSSVNQAPVTGESIPVDKEPARDVSPADWQSAEARHRVFAGTINGTGSLEVVVVKTSSESTLSRVVQLVQEAETQRSPTQRFTDRFEKVFVPAVILGAVLLMFAWVVVDEPASASFYRAMAVLVAASPCALAIATPSAVLSGVARAGRGGVLVKGGAALENLGALDVVAFDKTGTLTEGRPRVTDLIAIGGTSETEVLTTAAVVERLSDHPLARAVVTYAAEQQLDDSGLVASQMSSITGLGIAASIGGEKVLIGKDDLFTRDGTALPSEIRNVVDDLERRGRTTMVVKKSDVFLGVIGIMDSPRQAASSVIADLRRKGIRKMILVSGDNQLAASAVADAVGIDEAHGDLLPEDKVAMIAGLGSKTRVAMVGDGVNDAPAMAHATVGIAMGAAGSDVALETADVALMADRLEHLPFAVGLSRRTAGIIRQNLWLSLGMVLFLVPATILGLGIGPAVALHEGSTLVVVVNALRLLAYKE